MRCVAVMVPLIAASAALCNGCATPRTLIEIPACADRVEVTGQTQRLGPRRFELDHTFDLMLTRTQLSYQADGNVQTFVVESNQPDPLRLFFGVGSIVVGALLLGSASYDLAGGEDVFAERPFYAGLFGTGLVVLGTGAAATGWHPAQSYITFPEACPDGDVTYDR